MSKDINVNTDYVRGSELDILYFIRINNEIYKIIQINKYMNDSTICCQMMCVTDKNALHSIYVDSTMYVEMVLPDLFNPFFTNFGNADK